MAGAPNTPASKLRFRATPYRGTNDSASMQWRLAEITPPAAPREPRLYEIRAVWESDELAISEDAIALPPNSTKPDHIYRVRVRMKDATGCWSHWSAPYEFTARK
jgi:hypothetical protein